MVKTGQFTAKCQGDIVVVPIYKNSSEDEIANVNFLRRRRTRRDQRVRPLNRVPNFY